MVKSGHEIRALLDSIHRSNKRSPQGPRVLFPVEQRVARPEMRRWILPTPNGLELLSHGISLPHDVGSMAALSGGILGLNFGMLLGIISHGALVLTLAFASIGCANGIVIGAYWGQHFALRRRPDLFR